LRLTTSLRGIDLRRQVLISDSKLVRLSASSPFAADVDRVRFKSAAATTEAFEVVRRDIDDVSC
jgi:hypothetical protein